MSQFPLDGCAYVVRTARSDAGLAPALRAAVAAADGQLEKIEVLPLTEVLSGSLGDRRLMMILSCSLAAVSLLLTAIGLYGVVAYTVAESVRGIAVRMALGIQPLQVIGLVARQGLRLTFVGLSLGLLGFLLINKLLVGYLYGVGPVDLPTVAAVMALLALVTCLACAAPALRARRIAPALLLREI
jgi:ABC-type antimicrobial peptide transport system permease subunit